MVGARLQHLRQLADEPNHGDPFLEAVEDNAKVRLTSLTLRASA